MSLVNEAEQAFETTASAVQEKRKLRRHFRRFDMFFFLICTVVTLDTVGAVAANGAQGFTWLIFLGIFSHERLQYELSQIVPLAIIVVIGIVFYILGGRTRKDVAVQSIGVTRRRWLR